MREGVTLWRLGCMRVFMWPFFLIRHMYMSGKSTRQCLVWGMDTKKTHVSIRLNYVLKNIDTIECNWELYVRGVRESSLRPRTIFASRLWLCNWKQPSSWYTIMLTRWSNSRSKLISKLVCGIEKDHNKITIVPWRLSLQRSGVIATIR